jgi:hypothetical protein
MQKYSKNLSTNLLNKFVYNVYIVLCIVQFVHYYKICIYLCSEENWSGLLSWNWVQGSKLCSGKR